MEFDAAKAADFNHVIRFSHGRISETVLEEMYLDLDHDEVISIIFLMTNKCTDISAVINALKNDCKNRFFEITKENNWGEKLLEALITIDNINIVIKLGFINEEIEQMKSRYSYNIHNVSENLNRVVKSLYFLCKELTDSKVKKLVDKIYKDLEEPVLHLTEEKMLLEIYILDWLHKKYISIDEDNPILSNFINILKINGLLPSSFDFESWKLKFPKKNSNRKKNQQDSSESSGQSLKLENTTKIVNIVDYDKFPWKDKEHRRLCIIVNQVQFTDQLRHETRIGSDIDSRALATTFEGLRFEIREKKNLTAASMNDFLDSLNEKEFDNYAAIFLCILSHGREGEVIFSDDKAVTVKKIQKKVCCKNLKNVFKFIILQSCQGKKYATLKTDSPAAMHLDHNSVFIEDPSSIYQRHFGLYQATVNEYVSVRHETEGSWFIQDACDELRKTTPIKLTQWVTNVNKRVNSRKINSENSYIVQVPCLKDSTISEDYEFPKYCGR